MESYVLKCLYTCMRIRVQVKEKWNEIQRMQIPLVFSLITLSLIYYKDSYKVYNTQFIMIQ